ncbi:BTB domain-containing protein [Mycena chlorophos]|uniref:BTB domain-containing protein n=1 Tax=Mycena chlorophos TaxID=658473 RepID=A0A8H6SBT9_MYCCL|nr:BTB domain-containing protein [Mycena chlorophos]
MSSEASTPASGSVRSDFTRDAQVCTFLQQQTELAAVFAYIGFCLDQDLPNTSSNGISMCFECHTFLDKQGLILPTIDLSPLITAAQSATVGTHIRIPTPQPFYVRFVPRNPANADTLLVNDTMCSNQLDGTWIVDVDTWADAQTKTIEDASDGMEIVELVTKARKIPRPDDRFLWKLPAAVELHYVLCLAFSQFFSFSNWLGNPDAPPALRKTVEQLYTLFVLGQARRLAVGGIENLGSAADPGNAAAGRDSAANQGDGGSGGGSAGATVPGPASQWHAVDGWRRRVHHAMHEQIASLPTLEAHDLSKLQGMMDLEKVMTITGYDEMEARGDPGMHRDIKHFDIVCDTILSVAGGFDDLNEEVSHEFANMKATSSAECEFAMVDDATPFPFSTSRTARANSQEVQLFKTEGEYVSSRIVTIEKEAAQQEKEALGMYSRE